MNISIADWIIITGYLALMLGLGIFFSRKNTSTEEYFLGGRSFGGWVIGLSLVGTSISSITFLAFPADAFKTSWMRYLTALMLPFAMLIVSRFFLPFFRRGNITSAYEYLEERFGGSVRLYAAWVFISSQLVRLAIILYLLSLLVHQVTGLDPVLCVISTGVVISFYTIIGGIDAVIWTDVIQTFILVLGGLLCLAFIVVKLPGGMSEIISTAIEYKKLSFHDMINGELVPIPVGFSLHEKTILMMFILGITGTLTAYCSDQNIIQRYCAAKSTREARKAMWVTVFSSVPIWGFYMFLGTALFVFFHHFPTLETEEMLSGLRKSEEILPFFILNYLPPGILGLVLAAAMSAAMSSLDSNINAVSTVFIVDIYRRYMVKNKSDRHYLKVAWFMAAVASVFMIGGAIVLLEIQTQTLQDTANILVSIFAGGMLGLYLLGFFTKMGTSESVWFGIICTSIFTTWTILSSKGVLPEFLSVPFDLYYTGLIGNVIMFTVAFIMSSLFRKTKHELAGLTVWTMNKGK